jgi:hypothetical protein
MCWTHGKGDSAAHRGFGAPGNFLVLVRRARATVFGLRLSRGLQFAEQPAEHVRLDRIGRFENFLDMIALKAFEGSSVDPKPRRRYPGRHHRCCAHFAE